MHMQSEFAMISITDLAQKLHRLDLHYQIYSVQVRPVVKAKLSRKMQFTEPIWLNLSDANHSTYLIKP